MKNFAFISRHEPTTEQVAMAAEQGIALHHIGDCDAFAVTPDFVVDEITPMQFQGVVVVHPAAAMRLCSQFAIGVFENANRAAPGAPPQFFPKALHVYDLVSLPGLVITE